MAPNDALSCLKKEPYVAHVIDEAFDAAKLRSALVDIGDQRRIIHFHDLTGAWRRSVLQVGDNKCGTAIRAR